MSVCVCVCVCECECVCVCGGGGAAEVRNSEWLHAGTARLCFLMRRGLRWPIGCHSNILAGGAAGLLATGRPADGPLGGKRLPFRRPRDIWLIHRLDIELMN